VKLRPHNPIRWDRLAAISVLAGAIAVTASGQMAGAADDTKQTLENVQRDLKGAQARREQLRRTAKTYATELSSLKLKLVSAAQRAQDHEARVSTLEQRIEKLFKEKTEKSANLNKRRRELMQMLAALQRLSRHPPVALIALPASPTDTVRSAILLRGAVPRIESEATRLKQDLTRLTELRSNIALEQEELSFAGKALDSERQQLASLIDRKISLERQASAKSLAAKAHVAELATQARDLQDLINRLSASRRARIRDTPKPQKKPTAKIARTTPSAGRLPAQGRIVQRFRRSGGKSNGRKGITIQTRTHARVVSPGDGEIMFAGPFRGYGQLLIIEHGGGYHVLLAGLSRVDGTVGDEVLEGEPVGVMGSPPGLKPKLYFELRRNGRPVNPLPWLAARKDKVSG
jgi:septal ring factor EnvC (AmiA/AmiB activator)